MPLSLGKEDKHQILVCDFILLGAEKQAAVSFAAAYPRRTFMFVTDQAVVDGWDLANVHIRHICLGKLNTLSETAAYLSLSTRYTSVSWSERLQVTSESNFQVLSRVYRLFPEISLCITKDFSRFAATLFVVKGDLWHKPDGLQTVKAGHDAVPADIFNCGLFYQEFVPGAQRLIPTGSARNGKLQHAVVRIYRESIAREEHILAAETIADERISELTTLISKELGYEGLFTFGWVRSGERLFLTSVRPTPAPLAALLKQAGVDLLDPEKSVADAAAPGFKMIGNIHYTSYQPLPSC